MDLEFFEALDRTLNKVLKPKENKIISNEKIATEEIELANKLDAVEEFAIDRFEEDIAVLENINTKEILNIKRKCLPNIVIEGDIIKRINGKFCLDKEKTIKRKDQIEERFKKLKGD